MKPIVIFKGSFNPPHICHLNIAKVVEEKFGVKPVMMISSSVYQKGWIDPKDLTSRLKILNELGYSVMITKDGYFHKNTEYIRAKFKQPIVYVVGSDTLNRILESSYHILNPKDKVTLPIFGKEEQVTLDGMSEVFRKLEIERFEYDFKDVTFFVINRPGSELSPDASYVKDYYTLVEEHPDFFYISSTKIREMKANNDIEGIRKLIPAKIFDKYINLI